MVTRMAAPLAKRNLESGRDRAREGRSNSKGREAMAAYAGTRTGAAGQQTGWAGKALKGLVAKVKALVAARRQRELERYHERFDLEKGYEYWMDAIFPPESHSYRR